MFTVEQMFRGTNIAVFVFVQSWVDASRNASRNCVDQQTRTEGVMDLYGWMEMMQSMTMRQGGYPTQ
jgi:hypothetical protein